MSDDKGYMLNASDDVNENGQLQNELRTKRICRFCLSQRKDKLGSIYTRDARFKSSAPLPIQIMAIASIEVYTGDGMPTSICSDCRVLFEHSYRFKQMCKRAETLLRQYPLTGKIPAALPKPRFPHELVPKTATTPAVQRIPSQQQQSLPELDQQEHYAPQSQPKSRITIIRDETIKQMVHVAKTADEVVSFKAPKKILNSNPVESPEPPVPKRFHRSQIKKEAEDILSKFDNDEEISLEDVKQLIAATDDEEFISIEPQPSPTKRPKLLNKSSIRILNKEANITVEPRLSKPQVKRDEDGNVEIVTEILDPSVPYETEPDPVKTALPVETNVFPCPHCERSFPLVQLRDIHMTNHMRVRQFQCGECDRSFFSKYDLQKHNLVHTGAKPYKCPGCDKSFTRATLLHRHEKSHTDIPKFLCVYCEKAFISKDEMQKHTERHLKNRPYKCKTCDKSFAFKQGLDRHETVHARDQPFPCQYCDQSFSTASKLARHLTAHAGKRPYPCKFCSKSYLLSHHLSRHMRCHTHDKVSFKCFVCRSVFSSRNELISHCSVHATEILICPLCKELFETEEEVTAHISAHSEGEAFACEFCDLIYLTAAALQKHIDDDHVLDMAAYHENDKSQGEESKQTGRKKDVEVIVDLQQTIDEMLTDINPNDSIEKSDGLKEDSDEIVLSTKIEIDHDDFVDDNNIKDENDGSYQSMAKIQKTNAGSSGRTVRQIEKPYIITEKEPRRKAQPATRASTATSSKQKSYIKIDKNAIVIDVPKDKVKEKPSINAVLKALPRGVSVRRSVQSTSLDKAKRGEGEEGSTVKAAKVETGSQPVAAVHTRVVRRAGNDTKRTALNRQSALKRNPATNK